MSGRFETPGGRSSPPGGDGEFSAERGRDRFAELVARVAADPDNAYNVDRYRWVLDEPAARSCEHCGESFWPGESYAGGPARGRPRRYCSPGCASRAGWERHWARRTAARRWGSAA